jgi:hypothetical protein
LIQEIAGRTPRRERGFKVLIPDVGLFKVEVEIHIRVDLLDTSQARLVSLPGSFPLPAVRRVLGIAHEWGWHHIWRGWELDRHGVGEFLALAQLTIGLGVSPAEAQEERPAVVHRLHIEVGDGAPSVA